MSLSDERQRDILLSEMQHLAEVIHKRAYSHVPQWRVSSDHRGVLSQIDNMTAGLIERLSGLEAAVSWVQPPFVDDSTPEYELRDRIRFLVKDAARASGMEARQGGNEVPCEARQPGPKGTHKPSPDHPSEIPVE